MLEKVIDRDFNSFISKRYGLDLTSDVSMSLLEQADLAGIRDKRSAVANAERIAKLNEKLAESRSVTRRRLNESANENKNDSGAGRIINPSRDQQGMIAKKRTQFDRGNKPAKIYESDEEQKKFRKDLSNVKGSMVSVLNPYVKQLENKTKAEIVKDVKKLFDDNGIATKASKRLLLNLARAKSDEDAQFIITNSYLAGSGMAVEAIGQPIKNPSAEEFCKAFGCNIGDGDVEECLTEAANENKNDSGAGYIINPKRDETGMIAKKRTSFDRGNKPAKVY